MSPTFSDEKIIQKLKNPKPGLLTKLHTWPEELLGKALSMPATTFKSIEEIIESRHHLTHSKTIGFSTYDILMSLDGKEIIRAISEYMVRYCETEGIQFPYWLIGWNYLNPGEDGDVTLMNNQEFADSIHSIGINTRLPLDHTRQTWLDQNMKGYENYIALSKLLQAIAVCQPKNKEWPLKPILCRQWWHKSHQNTCGHST